MGDRNYLCVGGPLDGMVVAWHSHTVMEVDQGVTAFLREGITAYAKEGDPPQDLDSRTWYQLRRLVIRWTEPDCREVANYLHMPVQHWCGVFDEMVLLWENNQLIADLVTAKLQFLCTLGLDGIASLYRIPWYNHSTP